MAHLTEEPPKSVVIDFVARIARIQKGNRSDVIVEQLRKLSHLENRNTGKHNQIKPQYAWAEIQYNLLVQFNYCMNYKISCGRAASTMCDDSDVPNAFEIAFIREVRLHISPKDVFAVAIWRRALLNKLKRGSAKLT